MKDDQEVDTHESYGMVAMNRVTGTRRNLFGSHLKEHSSTIRIVVRRGQRVFNNGEDYYMSSDRRPIVELELSAAQFSELITSMNVGDGVPCTLLSVNGELVASPPVAKTQAERVRSKFREKMESIGESLRENLSEIDSILAKKIVNSGDKKKIRNIFSSFMTEIQSNIPFVLEQFEESAEKIVTHSKQEVDAFVRQIFIAAGIKSVKDQEGKLLLPGPKEE